ncbi:predicted protein [Phaeodactylum tricornutum CCAP 1055/1]|jgi:hypothetical protein|uniref:Uncharacterized protein n=2 Tax=Phaeodactylum tricornutum TaxID=2850 RepID=B7FZQ6_PHATC|nr:predicted protein [Phaeodactylum tricornutum CCAP 1055/1]EEC48179.1 predicted protein [Phaeodactylum tricornutum CCAP 1055/1]|mmetsp:Transcript_76792/g.205128  ORF Transcript_76792/g.205128 Transcript_76792/m.205128 type:complete len:367 (-) Transcript_76792:121-1221(-)|eukprot:XP_002179988.1 predicted protein [Phaeodactylum tricornutum CCAP 1055/1]
MTMMSTRSTLLFLASLLIFDNDKQQATAFTPLTISNGRVGWVASTTRRSATIYSPDGVAHAWDEDDFFYDETGTLNASPPNSPHNVYQESGFGPDLEELDPHKSLKSLISKEAMPELARLAVAFAPPDQALELDEIEHVEVLSVDKDHIQIEVVLCERDGCVTLAIPVSFPSPCGIEDKFSECVIDNIDLLNTVAHEDLAKLDSLKNRHEDVAHDTRTMQILKSTSDLELPSWWEAPGLDRVLADECDNVRNLLNELEFQDDVKCLTEQALANVGGCNEWAVDKAACAMVGPAGLMLRATIVEIDADGNEPRREQVAFPVGFGRSAPTIEALRAAVLGMVAAASSAEASAVAVQANADDEAARLRR